MTVSCNGTHRPIHPDKMPTWHDVKKLRAALYNTAQPCTKHYTAG